jgi:uncharacterized protein
MTTADASLRAPTTAAERALAPDLARGVMLLLIALANTPWYLYTRPTTPVVIHSPDGSLADRVTQAVIITTVDLRTYPMFAFLFGYGIVQLYTRQVQSGTGPTAARRLLRRRHWWLVAFGLLHSALLWVGDILATYGVVGLVMVALFFRRRDRTLLIWSGVLAAVSVLVTVASIAAAALATPTSRPEAAPFDPFAVARAGIAEPDYLESVLSRLAFAPLLVVFQGFATLVIPTAFLLAVWAARRRILEQPEAHLPLLRRTAAIGITVGWLGGLSVALHHLGVTSVPEQVSWVYSGVQTTTGLFGGVGYVALFGLISHAYRGRRAGAAPGRGVVALAAVGQRSLTCYLAQSVLFAPLLCAWGLGLGAYLTSWSVALVAVAGWLLTVLLAYALERAGRRGPAEVALRRLAYGRRLRGPATPVP